MSDEGQAIIDRLTRIEAQMSVLPFINGAITSLQHDTRMVRAAINSIARINVTAGEIEAMHTDIDRVLTDIRNLNARVATLESSGD